MTEPMRLFCKNGWWHVEVERNRSRALRTRDKKVAQAIFREMKREWLHGRLLKLDDYKRLTISQLSEDFTARSGVSKWTIKKDGLSLKLLREAIGDMQIRAITRDKVREFKTACLSRKAKPVTVNGYLQHIKAALRWAKTEGYLEKVPRIEMEATPKRLPRFLHVDTINAIMGKAEKADADFHRYLMFLLWTGCRRREGLGLTWQKIDFKARTAAVRGKGAAERLVPLLPPVLQSLKPVKKDIGPVFRQWHPDTVSKMFHALALLCGADARLHDLRHSCATYLLKSGVPMEYVQKILGHASIKTTQIYAEVLQEVMQKEMEKLRFE